MLVGDILVGCKELVPDIGLGVYQSPYGTSVPATFAASAIGGETPPDGTYTIRGAYVTPWGIVTIAGSTSVVIAAGEGFTVSFTGGNPLPSWATHLRIYFGLGGTVSQYKDFIVDGSVSAPGTPSTYPTRNTAIIADDSGGLYGIHSYYRWLVEALESAASLCGGIPDMTGIRSVANQGMYSMTGQWSKLNGIWYDGWPVSPAGKSDLFYINRVIGTPWSCVAQHIAERVVLEFQAQPHRSGAQTTLAGDISVVDNSIPCTSLASFEPSSNLVLIGGSEIVAYGNTSGNSLTGCIRGLGGTKQQAHLTGASVEELNIAITGLRQFATPGYAPGDAFSTLAVPAGWRTALIHFMLAKAREGEQDYRESQRNMSMFTQLVTATLRNKVVVGPRQIGGSSGNRVTMPGLGSLGGGVIVR